MKTIIFILLLIHSFAYANEEDAIFDSNRTTAIDLLQKEYSNSKVLFMGLANHANHKHIDQLSELLKIIGTDPKLKFIVIERAGDLSEFYEILSKQNLKDTLNVFKFQSEVARKQSLCFGEWAYTIDKFFPDIRAINQRRDAKNPLIVKSVDGMRSTMPENYPGLGKKMVDEACKVTDVLIPPIYNASSNREEDTARTFHSNIWSKLGPGDKAIILYNRGHLVTSFKTCNPYMVNPDLFEARFGYLTWIDYFFEMAPEAKEDSSLVIFDEKWSEKRDGTTFEFSRRQSSRYPGEDWAVPLNPFANVLKETGIDMMTATSDFRTRTNSTATSDSLPEIAHGLIWNAKAHLLNRSLKGQDYETTKEYCVGY